MDLILNQLLSGLSRSAFLFLVASGLSLSYGIVGVLNLGTFALYMVGAYLSWTFWNAFFPNPFSFWIATLLTFLAVPAIAFLIERIWLRAFYRRILPEVLLGTFVLMIIAEDTSKLIWGASGRSIIKPSLLDTPLSFFGITYPSYAVFVIVLAVLAACGIWFTLYRTKFGRIIRAVKDNPEMVATLGIPLPKIYVAVSTLCGLLIAMASVSWSVMGTATLGMTGAVMVQTFCVLIIGGMGSFMGTVVGALVCGEVYALGILFLPRLALLFVVGITGIILAVRPWGLFGVKGMLH